MTSLKLRFLVTFAIWFCWHLGTAAAQSNGCDGAGNCYVRAGATGSGTGADWTNAYTGFGSGAGRINPTSMARGVTYYVAGGTYSVSSGLVFNVADSGTTPINIYAATVDAHGSSTGWNNSYVSPATFQASSTINTSLFDFESDYWNVSGVYNTCGSSSSEPFPPCGSGYGFVINNNNGSNQPLANPPITIAANESVAVNNVVLSFFEIAGDADSTGTYCVQGLHVYSVVNGAQSSNNQLLYSYIHDTSNGPAYFTATSGMVVDHNWFLRDGTAPNCHSEVGVSPAGSTGTTNITFSNNYFENLQSTAMLATPSAGSGGITGMYIYGNVFFCNSAEATMGVGTVANCPGGDGFIFLFNGPISNVNIYNNNFDSPFSGDKGSIDFADGVSTTFTNVTVENNVFSNANGQSSSQIGLIGCPGSTGGATCNSFTYGYLSYMNYPQPSGDTSGTAQHTTSNPYVNAGTNTAGADNYELAADTVAWFQLNAPYNVDPTGASRTSSRGSFQYDGSAPPSPPKGLTAVVN